MSKKKSPLSSLYTFETVKIENLDFALCCTVQREVENSKKLEEFKILTGQELLRCRSNRKKTTKHIL